MLTGTVFHHKFHVSENVYHGFIETFNDRNPLHINTEFAIQNGFKGCVMHGNILNGFLSYFIGECLPKKNVIIETQTIKFILPVYLNDELELKVTISDFFESVGVYEMEFYFKNNVGKKVAKGTLNIGLLL